MCAGNILNPLIPATTHSFVNSSRNASNGHQALEFTVVSLLHKTTLSGLTDWSFSTNASCPAFGETRNQFINLTLFIPIKVDDCHIMMYFSFMR